VLEVARRVAKLPPDVVQINKRTVHRSMELKGFRTAIRQGTELCTLGTHQKSFHEFMKQMASGSLTQVLQDRDEPFGDYRTREEP
jgi:enoyl-CoA hydratase